MKISLARRRAITGMAFVSFWVIGFLVFTLYPLADTLWLSLNKVSITGAKGIQTEFAGIKNYSDIFLTDVDFMTALTGYLSEVVVYVPVIIVFSLIAAMLLNKPVKGVGIFRTIFFLPVIISSGPVIGFLRDNGALTLPGGNDLAALFSNSALPGWLTSLAGGALSGFITILWNSGLQILVFLAALQKLDVSMYEAALIDGVSQWEVFWKLTLKQLNPMIVVNVLFTIVMHGTFSLNPFIVKIRADMQVIERSYGYASALSWIYFAVLMAVILVSVLLVRRREKA